MRLIKADDVKELINGLDSLPWEEQVDEMVDAIPTAYEPDKVAEEVREVANRIHNYCEEIDWHIPEEERTGYEMLPDIWKLSEIVKKGGVADET